MNTKLTTIALSLAALFAVAGPAHAAPGGVNSTPITINDNANASLYPSTIDVTTSAPITSVSVRLINMQHTRLQDLTVLLVSPTGKAVQLMANVDGAVPSPASFFFAEPGEWMNGQVVLSSRVFRPTVVGQPVALPAPAPPLPYATNYASLIGDNMLGEWSLYVRDNVAGVSGSIAGGWAIGINGSSSTPFLPEFTYQGFVTEGGTPVTGVRDIRLQFWSSPYSTLGGDSRGTFTAANVQVTNGRFTILIPREGNLLSDDRQLFVETAVKEVGGSTFTVLAPRQQMTATPFAIFAQNARIADFATEVLSVPFSSVTNVPANILNPFTPWASGTANSIFNTNPGNVSIGDTDGTSKLTVQGTIESRTGGFKFPDGSTQTAAAFVAVASTSITFDAGSIAANGEGGFSTSFAGAPLQTTDVVLVSPQNPLPANFSIAYARVTSGSSINVVIRNHNTVPVNPPSNVFNVRVIR
ncbi:MAG: proprotein convertase P-domain-containing protein [Phycisphaerales bacterium]